ncbi:MAG: helix-turn-helix transcriptional regulator [Oscillospiraceae bacterium]|nr:helix-turn-helix transcriptional regulator [Oscillospiraceae bacterium]
MYGERLKLLRKERKIQQKELADLLGISIRGYQFYESEDNEPNIKVLTVLADFYGVTIDYLVGRTDKRG